jgi:carbonic anhydrase
MRLEVTRGSRGDILVDVLLKGHREFARRYVTEEREFLARLASQGQSPSTLFIGCSDSRVVPELLTASSPGDLFVVRNVANLVPPFVHADASVGAALEYAVGHLGVAHVVVCGHVGCGGVRAAMDKDSHAHALPSLGEWLRIIDLGTSSIGDASLSIETRWGLAVEENVLDQLANLATYPVVLEALEGGRLTMHAWVYDIQDGGLSVWNPQTARFEPAEIVMAG